MWPSPPCPVGEHCATPCTCYPIARHRARGGTSPPSVTKPVWLPRGMHSLRHSAGTRLFAETHDLEETARHLGHVKLEATRIYATWSDKRLRETLGWW